MGASCSTKRSTGKGGSGRFFVEYDRAADLDQLAGRPDGRPGRVLDAAPLDVPRRTPRSHLGRAARGGSRLPDRATSDGATRLARSSGVEPGVTTHGAFFSRGDGAARLLGGGFALGRRGDRSHLGHGLGSASTTRGASDARKITSSGSFRIVAPAGNRQVANRDHGVERRRSVETSTSRNLGQVVRAGTRTRTWSQDGSGRMSVPPSFGHGPPTLAEAVDHHVDGSASSVIFSRAGTGPRWSGVRLTRWSRNLLMTTGVVLPPST